ncbi:glycoside hydrolase 100 family protein [Pedobacter mucosus]|uniref:glycoside hydrolase 100 family protein n=1 Tax=Pedobacter mucosus TaxID=2895286 RepID=UPI001EE44B34|nr:glycoside hydrolase 100 family protein [Pedobacter mucosus]UKT65853.1 hypothetical protein LOK61_08680 [Pedobacter mucosus]
MEISTDYEKSIALLYQASTPSGFVAAVREQDNYKRVWTRDGVITSIAALLSGDKKLIETSKATIETLFDHQHHLGFMPSNVTPESGEASYGGTCGRADNPSWAVIGLCAYTLLSNNLSLWEKYQTEVEKCFAVMESWEFNGKNLIYVPQSGDWADEYIQHGYILFDQLLRVWALKLVNKIDPSKQQADKAIQIVNSIKQNYWKNAENQQAYAPNLKHQMINASSHYWLMGFNPSRIYKYFDLQANTFSLLLNLGDESQNQKVIDAIKTLYNTKLSMLPSFYPTIEEGDADMNELKNNYAYSFRNKPNFFHNGGLWPVWNGWLVMALKKHGENELAEKISANINNANAMDDCFNECFHGLLKTPCGVNNCTWSAAGAVLAQQDFKSFEQIFNFND